MKATTSSIILFLLSTFVVQAQQELSAKEIVKKADQQNRGASSYGEMTMKIIRPGWTREMSLKSWSKGNDYSLILVTSPARDKGTAFLKRSNEIWNWQPTIERVIKMPPSMMGQSWMGSDFTNDDLVRESSILEDYEHEILGEQPVEGRPCYQIALIPKEDAPVVWGKVLMWISKEKFLQLKTEFYDEDGYLVNTMLGKDIKKMDDRLLPSRLEVIPADEDGHKTIVEYKALKFNDPIDKGFFSLQNMKRVR